MSRTFARLRLSAGAIAVATGLIVPSLAYAQASPAPYMSAMRYDAANRPTGTIAPDPDGAGPLKYAATRTTYDASGRMTKVETGELASWQSESIAPANWSGFTVLSSVETAYDVLDRKIQALGKDATGAIVSAQQISYDARGRLDCTATRMNLSAIPALGSNACTLGTAGSFGNDRITQNVYDVAGQLLVIKRAVGTPRAQDYVTYTYTLNGKQATVKDANGNLASMSYDGHDRQTRWTFPSKTTAGQVNTADYEEYVYDANGNRTSLRKRDGSVLTYQYDNLNRMTVKIVPERAGLAATHTRDVYYGYDNRGLQTYARFDSATGEGVASSYDGFGRLTSTSLVMDGATRTLSYARDKNGNRTRVTYPDSNYFQFAYDGLNRMTLMQRNADNGIAGFAYNNRGGRLQVASGSYTNYGYDNAGRLTSIAQDMTGTVNDVTYGLDAYNPTGQVTQRSTSNDAYVYTGDMNVNRTYAVNGLNQYISAGPATFGYDANGNLTSDGANSFVYDVENRLVSRTGAATANLRYDPLGRLYETSGGAAGITRFLYDGDELVAEYNGAGTMLRRYVHGTGVDDPMAVFEGSGVADSAARLVKTNHQGSVVALTDWNGNLLSKNSYDDWGIPGSTNASIAQGGRFSYTGQAWVPELGMYYYKARIYSPTLGRFMQTDPIGHEDDINLYGYVGNDPVNSVDPTGLACGSLVKGQVSPSCFNASNAVAAGNAAVGDWNKGFNSLSAEQKQEVRDQAYQRNGYIVGNEGIIFRYNTTGFESLKGVIPKVWIQYDPGFFSHVRARHFGADTDTRFGSKFRRQFQNDASVLSLSQFAANAEPGRDTKIIGHMRYTALYTGTVGYLQGSGTPTYLVTFIAADTYTRGREGMRIFRAVTLYPGTALE